MGTSGEELPDRDLELVMAGPGKAADAPSEPAAPEARTTVIRRPIRPWLASLALTLAAAQSQAQNTPPGVLLPTRDVVGLADFVVAQQKRGVDNARWRYLSFTTAPEDELRQRHATVRYALALLNPGTAAESAYLSKVSDGLWAVDVTALGWPAAAWDSFSRDGSGFYEEAGGSLFREFFRSRTGSEQPLLRHDEFLAGCLEPDRYAAFLSLPATKGDFLSKFLPGQLKSKSFGVVAEGLTVTKNPGQVARFESQSGAVVWMRTLHASKSGRGDAVLHPQNTDGGDHSEFFWRLPNGLDGMATYDRSGRLALSVPTTLSRDRDGQAVRLGVSCFGCHSGPKALDHVEDAEKLALFNHTPSEWDKDRLVLAVRGDGRAWAAALSAVNGTTPAENSQAFRGAVDAFLAPVGPAEADAELGFAAKVERPVPRDKFGDAVAAAAAKSKINRLYLEAAKQRLGVK